MNIYVIYLSNHCFTGPNSNTIFTDSENLHSVLILCMRIAHAHCTCALPTLGLIATIVAIVISFMCSTVIGLHNVFYWLKKLKTWLSISESPSYYSVPVQKATEHSSRMTLSVCWLTMIKK